MMDPVTTRILYDFRDRLRTLYGPRLVRLVLFGSRARGDAQPESDIDVLIVLKGPVNPGQEIARTGPITADLSLRNDVVISRIFVDEDSYQHRNSPLLLNVRREGVAV